MYYVIIIRNCAAKPRKIIKYTHINFIKEVKGIEEDMNKWNDIMHSWIKRLNNVQHPYFSKQSTDSRQYLSKCL